MEKEVKQIIFSDKIIKILKVLEDNNNYLAFELLWMGEPTAKYFNGLNITHVDSGVPNKASDFSFIVTVGGKKHMMKIGKFIRYFFPKLFADSEIASFAYAFNRIKNGDSIDQVGKKIEVKEFSYNPKDPRSTFLSMVTETYPHPHEEDVMQFLPNDLEQDKYGNYYKIIDGDDTTMFTSHLDTADRSPVKTTLFSKEEDGDEIIYTDGSTILGADDKSGVTIMMYMMAHNIPGLYYFFIGEERGGIGSNQLAAEYDKYEYLKNIKKCISFDRRRTISVITHQMGGRCCSDAFGTALCREYNSQGLNLSLDNGGIYTDSASFIDDIPECTNLSVGYENEHTGRELQNMTFLIQLCEASIKVNWAGLPVNRRIGLNQELITKHKKLIDFIKDSVFGLETKMVGFEDKIYIRIDLDDADIATIYDSLDSMLNVLTKHNVDSMVTFSETYIKIELK